MDKIFVGRVTAEEMNSTNGPWTKTKISFNQEDLDKLKQYQNEKGFVNLNFNRSKKGNEYIEIDTWQPTQQPAAPQSYTAPPEIAPAPAITGNNEPPMDEGLEEIPFNRLGDFEQ